MKLRRVDPSIIKVPEVRVTARFDEETWQQFQSSIKELGPVAPVICCQVGEELVLVDGLHRLAEAQRQGIPRVDVAVIEGDMIDVLSKNIFLDHMRGKTPPSEMVKVIEALYKEYGVGIEDIVKRTGLTQDYVEKLLKISELTPLIRQALDEGVIGVGTAEALTKIKDPITQEAVFHQIKHWGLKGKELKEYIDSVLEIKAQLAEVPPGQPQRVPTELRCFYCQEVKDITELANPNTCRSCSLIMLQAIGEAKAEADKAQEHQNGS